MFDLSCTQVAWLPVQRHVAEDSADAKREVLLPADAGSYAIIIGLSVEGDLADEVYFDIRPSGANDTQAQVIADTFGQDVVDATRWLLRDMTEGTPYLLVPPGWEFGVTKPAIAGDALEIRVTAGRILKP